MNRSRRYLKGEQSIASTLPATKIPQEPFFSLCCLCYLLLHLLVAALGRAGVHPWLSFKMRNMCGFIFIVSLVLTEVTKNNLVS